MAESPARAFLDEVLAPALAVDYGVRPHVTLTYAQSLDAKIAGVRGKQLRLSGKESMEMTHWMRTMHDAILIGIGTALNDDPQLNARYLPPREDGQSRPLPIPVILDADLRFRPDSKLLQNYAKGTGRQPWIVSGPNPDPDRVSALVDRGAVHLAVPKVEDGKLDFLTVLNDLKQAGIDSIMVEGGQRIISSLLATSPPLVDLVIITIAPMLVGSDGTGVTEDDQTLALQHIKTITLGQDAVVACKLL